MDRTISKARLEYQEGLKRPPKVKRKLRVCITTQFYPEKQDPNSKEKGCWELRVEGRLHDPDGRDAGLPKRKFSTFFKSLVIELDKELYGPDQHLVEWHRDRQSSETDGFQVKRPGNKDVKCAMMFMINYEPPKVKLEPRLAKLLSIDCDTRPNILYALWNYIRTHKLQDPVERDYINLDNYLSQIFRTNRVRFNDIVTQIQPLMQSPEPIQIQHRVRCDVDENGESKRRQAMYDIDVEIDHPARDHMKNFIIQTDVNEELQALDKQCHDLFKKFWSFFYQFLSFWKIFLSLEIIEQINASRMRHEFFKSYSENPSGFIEKWLDSQSYDLKKITQELTDIPDNEKSRSQFYKQPWVEEAVQRFFYNKLNDKRLELEQILYQKR